MYDLKKQIDSANAKLDKIIEAMKKNGDMVPFVAEKGAANGSSAEKIETKSEAKPVDLKASLKQAGVKSEGKTEMKSDKKAAKKKSSKKK